MAVIEMSESRSVGGTIGGKVGGTFGGVAGGTVGGTVGVAGGTALFAPTEMPEHAVNKTRAASTTINVKY